MKVLNESSSIITIPFRKNIAKANCRFRKPSNANLNIKSIARKVDLEFDLSEKIAEKYQEFLKQ